MRPSPNEQMLSMPSLIAKLLPFVFLIIEAVNTNFGASAHGALAASDQLLLAVIRLHPLDTSWTSVELTTTTPSNSWGRTQCARPLACIRFKESGREKEREMDDEWLGRNALFISALIFIAHPSSLPQLLCGT